jgi:hypothetical protein
MLTKEERVGLREHYASRDDVADVEALLDHADAADAKIAELKKHLDIRIREAQDGAWYWQGDGYDLPESLVCPVIMSAQTLRELLAKVG